jgi:hypothetical protein
MDLGTFCLCRFNCFLQVDHFEIDHITPWSLGSSSDEKTCGSSVLNTTAFVPKKPTAIGTKSKTIQQNVQQQETRRFEKTRSLVLRLDFGI